MVTERALGTGDAHARQVDLHSLVSPASLTGRHPGRGTDWITPGRAEGFDKIDRDKGTAVTQG